MRRTKVTVVDRRIIWVLWGGACAYCRAELQGSPLARAAMADPF